MNVFFIALGGFFGAILRFGISQKLNHTTNVPFPVSTFLINMCGTFLLGFLLGKGVNGSVYALLGIGFCGAFTTFSTFKLELIQLWLKKNKSVFFIYFFTSYLGGLFLAFMGFVLAQK